MRNWPVNSWWLFLDDDEDISAPMEGDDEEDIEGKGDVQEKEIKEEANEEGEKEKETPMEQQVEEDDVDPLDAYMEEVKQEVKKFNMGAMKGNDKVSLAERCSTLVMSSPIAMWIMLSFFLMEHESSHEIKNSI